MVRKDLSFSGLVRCMLNKTFLKISLASPSTGNVPLSDCLMSAFAMFSLKYPSLLKFDADARGEDPVLVANLKNIFGIGWVPSDTTMRERLDSVDPRLLDVVFKKLFATVQRGKGLEGMESYRGDYLISLDGTGVYASTSVSCPNCLVKHAGKENESYYHQNFCAVLVKPGCNTVLPIGNEAVVNCDGNTKNDCEFNAAKRLIPRLRNEHPHLPMCLTLDGLHSKAPIIKLCGDLSFRYIIGAKDSDHTHLLEQLSDLSVCVPETVIELDGSIRVEYRFANGLELNASNPDVKVNYLELRQYEGDSLVKRFAWVTNYPLCKSNVSKISAMGRARWKIENETFNTLKNQGYEYEHNFGHGQKNLSVIFSTLALLAFAVDQTLERLCRIFKAARERCGTKRSLWEKIRVYFDTIRVTRMEDFYYLAAKQITLNDVINSS